MKPLSSRSSTAVRLDNLRPVLWKPGLGNTPMIAKCANPACSREFRYLHEGRLFAIERYEKTATDGKYTSEFVSHPHAIEFYWLCNDCYRLGTLTIAAEEVTARFIPKPVVQSRADTDAVPGNTLEKEAA